MHTETWHVTWGLWLALFKILRTVSVRNIMQSRHESHDYHPILSLANWISAVRVRQDTPEHVHAGVEKLRNDQVPGRPTAPLRAVNYVGRLWNDDFEQAASAAAAAKRSTRFYRRIASGQWTSDTTDRQFRFFRFTRVWRWVKRVARPHKNLFKTSAL